MAGIVQNANTAAGWISDYKKIISGKGANYISLEIPTGVTAIRDYAFYNFRMQVNGLYKVKIPSSVKTIGYGAFYNSRATKVEIENGTTTIRGGAFASNSTLTTINFPNSITTIRLGNLSSMEYTPPFEGCSNLQYVTMEDGFNCNNLNLSASTKYSAETIAEWIDALIDRTGDTAYTLAIGATNLNKLTAEQIAIATNKNWNLA